MLSRDLPLGPVITRGIRSKNFSSILDRKMFLSLSVKMFSVVSARYKLFELARAVHRGTQKRINSLIKFCGLLSIRNEHCQGTSEPQIASSTLCGLGWLVEIPDDRLQAIHLPYHKTSKLFPFVFL